jgi:hypothetical protein
LIGEVREINGAIPHDKCAATVFVSASAYVEGITVIRSNAFRLPDFVDAVDEGSSVLLRLSLAPVDRIAVQCDLVEYDRVGNDKIEGYRGNPRTIRIATIGIVLFSDFWK